MIDEVEIAEFFYPGSIRFEGPDHIDCRVVCGVFIGEVVILGNFFEFSDINRSVENCT